MILQGRSEEPFQVRVGDADLQGNLDIPQNPKGVVLFAHGSGSSRLSPRNQFVARHLQAAGLGTCLVDLLSPEEDRDYSRRFDIDFLKSRLIDMTHWLQSRTSGLRLGYFGASTGAAAALRAAADQGGTVSAVVSRGGRPDLAWEVLREVQAPTLLIVGGNDEPVLDLNRQAYEELRTVKELVVIPGATHLFEEAGALEKVAQLASNWFMDYLPVTTS